LFSKAERALEIAGWSETARDDVEIFRLVDTEGLTPLLIVLNETPSGKGSQASAASQTQSVAQRALSTRPVTANGLDASRRGSPGYA
jgi:hypothetical protein